MGDNQVAFFVRTIGRQIGHGKINKYRNKKAKIEINNQKKKVNTERKRKDLYI